jgi:hypothetical protein
MHNELAMGGARWLGESLRNYRDSSWPIQYACVATVVAGLTGVDDRELSPYSLRCVVSLKFG